MAITNNFNLYSPQFNYIVLVSVEKGEGEQFSRAKNVKLQNIQWMDWVGWIPGVGNLTGFMRVVLSITDLFRLRQWKLELSPSASVPLDHRRGGYRLGGPANEETNAQRAPVQPETESLKEKELKEFYQKRILKNLCRGIIECIPVMGQIIVIAYSIILYKQQEEAIRTDIRTHPIETQDNNPPPSKPKQRVNHGKRMGTLSDLSTWDQELGQQMRDMTTNVTRSLVNTSFITVKYQDTDSRNVMRDMFGSMLGGAL